MSDFYYYAGLFLVFGVLAFATEIYKIRQRLDRIEKSAGIDAKPTL